MKEDDDFKLSLKPTQMEVPQLKPAFVIASKPRPTEKKKKKKLKKAYPFGSGTTSQRKTQDETVVYIGGNNIEVRPNAFPTPISNVASEKKSFGDYFARVMVYQYS